MKILRVHQVAFGIGLFGLLLAVVTPGRASAQPTISGASGQWTHAGTVTVNGSGFGTKATPAPLVWDDASGSNVSDKWDGKWPNAAGGDYDIAYRTPIRGIQPPHARTGRYLAGSHAGNGSNLGYNVAVWKRRDVTFPSATYLSWYQRFDDAWVFGGDNNLKNYVWAEGPDPYEGHYFYGEYNPRPTSRTSGCAWAVYDSGGIGLSPSMTWGSSCTNPMSGQWAKVEVMIRWSRSTDGFIKIFDNGRQVVNYTGRTDGTSTTTRVEGVGGFARVLNTNNWRYFTDIYMDTSLQHVVIGNASTLAASTRREVQVPTSWTNNSISLSVNLGAFTPGERAYVYVFDSNGNANASGHPITIGGTSTSPAAPTGLRIVPGLQDR